MSEPDIVYFSSPWSFSTIGAFLFLLVCLVVVLVRRSALVVRKGAVYYYVSLSFALGLFALICWNAISLFGDDGRWRAVIHREYFSCSSWSDGKLAMRVPWHHFTKVTRERTGKWELDVVLQFSLHPSYIGQVPWTDWVKSHGWVNCGISGVTDDPHRFDFATDTDEIFEKVWSAWIARFDSPSTRPTYKELMDARRATSPK
jgi:hypothetical protein